MATTQHMLFARPDVDLDRSIMSGSSSGTCSQPVGLDAVYAACKKIYPEQPNPLQVTALVKYW